MSQRVISFVAAAMLGLACVLDGRGAEPSDAEASSLADLSLEVQALLSLHRFGFTQPQLDALRKIAPETAPKAGRRKEQTNDKVRQALLDLRAALTKEDRDDDRIGELEDRLDELKAADAPDLDDDVELTDAARRRAPELLRSLTTKQVLAYLNEHSEDIPEPLGRLTEALDKVAGLDNGAWKELCEEIADELSWLMGGVDKKRARAVGAAVEQWLAQLRLASRGKGFDKQRPALERSARVLAAQVSPTAVMHNFTEHALAELLSNPRLGAALETRSSK